MHREKTLWEYNEKPAIYNPGRQASEETNAANTLIDPLWHIMNYSLVNTNSFVDEYLLTPDDVFDILLSKKGSL